MVLLCYLGVDAFYLSFLLVLLFFLFRIFPSIFETLGEIS